MKKGLFLADAVLALSILSLLGAILLLSAGRQRHASLRLKDQRAAVALAERAASRLHNLPPVPLDSNIRLERLAGGDTPIGQTWIRITATHNGRSASLITLAPLAAVQKEALHETASR